VGDAGLQRTELPTWLVLGSETLTFQLAATAVVCISLLLVLGWRTQLMTALAWVSACAFQFAARGTADYHNAVLCVLLFWRLALPTGAAASVDARAGRRSNLSTNLVRAASMGQDGTVVDSITGQPPTLSQPSKTGVLLRWMTMSDAPYVTDGWGIQHTYRNFLLTQRNGSGTRQLHRLALVWVHEPVLVLRWPEGHITAAAVEQVLGTPLSAPVYDEDTGSLAGTGPLSLLPEEQSLP